MQTLRPFALLLLAAPTALAQWTYVPSGTTAELRGLSMSRDVVWASGARGTVLRSTDGGRTWTAGTVWGASQLDFRSIHAFDAHTAVMASAGEAELGQARIFRTTDGGRHWRVAYATTEKGVFFDAIAFHSPRNGLLLSDPVGGRFRVLLTHDGGRTWQRAHDEPPALAGEAAFAASGSSLAVAADAMTWLGTGGGHARVMYSGGGGEDWSHSPIADTPVHAAGAAAGIFSVATLDGHHLVAAGGDYTKPRLAATSVALSDDGGRTWRPAAAPPAAYLSGVAYAGDLDRLVAVGLAGTFVSHDGGDHWVQTDTVPLNAVRFSGARGVAVGPRGRVAWTDGIP